jgi:5-methylcytosine-specific restriction endonuclease McrA
MDAPWLVKDTSRRCSVDGCELPYEANGMCHNHYMYDRRDRKRAAQIEPNGFTVERLNERLAMFGDYCWMCGEPIHAGKLNIEHVKPLAKGGAHTPANLRPSCAQCNSSKGDTWPFDTSTVHLRLDPGRLP